MFQAWKLLRMLRAFVIDPLLWAVVNFHTLLFQEWLQIAYIHIAFSKLCSSKCNICWKRSFEVSVFVWSYECRGNIQQDLCGIYREVRHWYLSLQNKTTAVEAANVRESYSNSTLEYVGIKWCKDTTYSGVRPTAILCYWALKQNFWRQVLWDPVTHI